MTITDPFGNRLVLLSQRLNLDFKGTAVREKRGQTHGYWLGHSNDTQTKTDYDHAAL